MVEPRPFPVNSTVVSRQGSETGQYWRYLEPSTPAFNAQVFDEQYLIEQALIAGSAEAGRGNTVFFSLEHHALVLRHYRRGGLVRHVTSRRYVYTGLAQTRAVREFDMLWHLHTLKLPAPVPYACQVTKRLLSYEASLITHRINGNTLAHQFMTRELADEQWQAIGSTLADFHRHGIFHADLNAHNILVDDEGRVSVIDFDRARVRALPAKAAEQGWCSDNINRLERSLCKVQRQYSTSTESSAVNTRWESGFALLRKSWQDALVIT